MNRIRKWLIKALGGYTEQETTVKVKAELKYALRDDLIDELRMKYRAQTIFIPEGNRIEVMAHSISQTVPALLNWGPAHVIIVKPTESDTKSSK